MSSGLRVAFETLGCKVNQAETELLANQFARAGFRLVQPGGAADIYILNTCTVTHIADRKSRHLLRKAYRRSPGVLVVATGCYAQHASGELFHLGGVDLVVGNDEKPNLLGLLEEKGYLKRLNTASPGPLFADGFRTRSLVKIQDGCNDFCSYCIVPLVRGRERSLPSGEIIKEVRERVRDGFKEVVITGVKVGSYSYDGMGLEGLLEGILAETAVQRMRLSSLQPQEISPELLDLWREGRLCPHFHLSLQSGSDAVLERMNRRYSSGQYWEAVSKIRAAVTDVAITTDIITGFPGETDAEFEESYRFCQEAGFARIHIFPYSPRAGTRAAQMPLKIEAGVKKGRTVKMLALARESMLNFNQSFLGRTVPVLWEKRSAGGVWSGHAPNYIKVYTRSDDDLTNEIVPAKLEEIGDDGVFGEI